MKKEAKKGNPHRGSSFEDFLAEGGMLPEVTAAALKRAIALKLQEILEKQNVSRSQLATRMQTSRAAVNRLLDPENSSLTVASLGKAAAVLGKKIEVKFLPA